MEGNLTTSPRAAININELGAKISSNEAVWTGTGSGGRKAVAMYQGDSTCYDFTSSSYCIEQ